MKNVELTAGRRSLHRLVRSFCGLEKEMAAGSTLDLR
jgi:hypothetical protein